jgi:hypothetical protein
LQNSQPVNNEWIVLLIIDLCPQVIPLACGDYLRGTDVFGCDGTGKRAGLGFVFHLQAPSMVRHPDVVVKGEGEPLESLTGDAHAISS